MISRRLAIFMMLMVAPGAAWLAAQNASDAGVAESPAIIIGTVAGDKGTTVSVPVYFRGGTPALRRVALSLDFISNSVKFEKASGDGALPPMEIQVAVNAEPLPADAKGLPRTRIKLIATGAGAQAGKALPGGLWTFLVFRLAPDAKPFAVSLQASEVGAETSSGTAATLLTEAGKVIVSAEDETQLGCFFFTH